MREKDPALWRDALKSAENFLVEGQINTYFYENTAKKGYATRRENGFVEKGELHSVAVRSGKIYDKGFWPNKTFSTDIFHLDKTGKADPKMGYLKFVARVYRVVKTVV